MKCPKCDYLGFDTGDRCKNCGYDFSLTAAADPKPALPLFAPADLDDDEPLVKLPATPRPPLAVRKTPDFPRLRAVPKPAPREVEPVLQFVDEGPLDPDLELHSPLDLPDPVAAPPRTASAAAPLDGPTPVGTRLAAALLDHLILAGIDVAVVYFTLRMAGLTPADWRMLPPAPLLTFLLLLKFAYFVAFTTVGGQTIGKMALNLRVVADGAAAVDATCAIRRTAAGLLASLPLGLGFLPALVGDRRALHDRIAHTRVVALRSA